MSEKKQIIISWLLGDTRQQTIQHGKYTKLASPIHATWQPVLGNSAWLADRQNASNLKHPECIIMNLFHEDMSSYNSLCEVLHIYNKLIPVGLLCWTRFIFKGDNSKLNMVTWLNPWESCLSPKRVLNVCLKPDSLQWTIINSIIKWFMQIYNNLHHLKLTICHHETTHYGEQTQ